MKRYVSPKSRLEVLEQVDDLRLDRHVERRDRLVADDEVGLERERAGDADALPLAARELVRIAGGRVGGEPDDLEELPHATRARCPPVTRPCMRSGSPTILPTLWRGLSDAYGSWKTICIRRAAAAARSAQRRDVLAVEDDPARGRLVEAEDRAPDRRLAAARLADQPERLAAATRSSTPSTALMSPTWRSRTRPLLIGNQTLRFSTSTRAPSAHRCRVAQPTAAALDRCHSSTGTG